MLAPCGKTDGPAMNSRLPSPGAEVIEASPHLGHALAADSDPLMLVDTDYEVVIAGASFAGLAVALNLAGRHVVLIDSAPLGEGVTSACAAPVSIVDAMHAQSSILQIHDHLMLHTSNSEAVWPLPEPFCTFDYRQLCRAAFAATGAEFVQARVWGRRAHTVQTTSGELGGHILVDATGWRAALAGGSAAAYVDRRWMAFGIESEVEYTLDGGLHFYFLPEIRDGYAWAFPAGSRVRFGVLSYRGRSKLGAALATFMGRFGLTPGSVHGGFLASGLREPVVDGVFVVGDASGHCLPLTGEGIRTAVLGGLQCGQLVRRVVAGQISSTQAARYYRDFTSHSERKFRALLWGNGALLALPLSAVGLLAKWCSRRHPLRMFMRPYLSVFTDVLSS